MYGHHSRDTLVALPAAVVWDIYGGLELGRLADKLLPDLIGKVEVIAGDGGAGTILKLTFPPGSRLKGDMIETFAKIDHENRVKESEVLEGGYRGVGFDVYRFRLEIVENGSESRIIRSSIVYEIDDNLEEVAFGVMSIRPLKILAETIEKYLIQNKTTQRQD